MADAWVGIDRTSPMSPNPGFRELENVYINRDGTELRRMPGWRAVARPMFGAYITPTGVASGSNPTITLAGHGLRVGDKVAVDGNSSIADGEYTVLTVPSTSTFTINATSAGTDTDGTFYVSRGYRLHGFKQIFNRNIVIGEDRENQVPTLDIGWITQASDGTTIYLRQQHWFRPGSPQTVTVATSGIGALNGSQSATIVDPWTIHVAAVTGSGTTWPTGGTVAFPAADITGLCSWVSGGVPSITTPTTKWERWPEAVRGQSTTADYTDIYPVHRKSVLDACEGRVLLASPGRGMCFQADVRTLDATDSNAPYTMPLGLPKGSCHTVNKVGVGSLAAGTYYTCIAYCDRWTGEYGLASDYQEVAINGTTETGLQVLWRVPRDVIRELPESVDVMVFLGMSPLTMRLVWTVPGLFGVGTNGTNAGTSIGSLPSESALPAPIVEVMPLGSKFIRTLRGWTLGGGNYGNEGLARATSAVISEQQSGTNSEIYTGIRQVNMGLPGVAPHYQGYELFNAPSSGSAYAAKSVLLDKFKYMEAGAGNFGLAQRWECDRGYMDSTETVSHIRWPRGMGWFSEQGEAQVSPAVNRVLFDVQNGADIEGAGTFRDSWVVASRTESFLFSPGSAPARSRPLRLSTEFGCIAANSFVECDMGTAWLSERGPVMWDGGGVRWIGAPVEDIFTACRRDSQGMMPHAIAGHDPARGLLFFGLHREMWSEYYDATTTQPWRDDDRSKLPCDFFLVYSYYTRQWTTWVPPKSLGGVYWIDQMLCDDGVRRTCFLAGGEPFNNSYLELWSAKIYAFEDNDGDDLSATDPALLGMETALRSSTAVFAAETISDVANVREGMSYYVESGGTVAATGVVSGVDTTTGEITLESARTWAAGDKLYVGGIPTRIQTNQAAFSNRPRGKATSDTATLRHTVETESGSYLTGTVGSTTLEPKGMAGYRTSVKYLASGEELVGDLRIYSPGSYRLKRLTWELQERG